MYDGKHYTDIEQEDIDEFTDEAHLPSIESNTQAGKSCDEGTLI